MKIAILGFGREGRSVLNFLKKHKRYKDDEMWVLDANPKADIPKGLSSVRGPAYLKNLDRFDLIFRSPGIPYETEELRRTRKKVEISSLTKLFFEHCPTKNIIGITGTKGKTTTSTLIYHLLHKAGYHAYLAGNVGKPALDILPKLNKDSWIVLELSSFQLQDLHLSPRFSVMLDVFPDHQDSHHSLKEYYEAKYQLLRHQNKNDIVFFFDKSGLGEKLARRGEGRKVPVITKNFGLFRPEDIKLKGEHMYRNMVMAATVAEKVGVPRDVIRKIATSFRGVVHRLELVRVLKSRNYTVEFYNDSASTNPNTTAGAVNSFKDSPFVILVGGHDKGLDYSPLRKALSGSSAKAVVLYGSNSKKVGEAIKNCGVPVFTAKTFLQAVRESNKLARQTSRASKKPVAVILSPGAASFDMFRNYAERGDSFRSLVLSLTK